jgi:uncharacterized protein (TIGR02300 family)
VAKPEWGIKRVCQGCGAKFYDLKRSPIVCPKCETVFDPDSLGKRSRSRPAAAKPKLAPVPAATEEDDVEVEEFESDDDIEIDEDSDDGLIEDTSDLDDDDGIGDVPRDTEDKDT